MLEVAKPAFQDRVDLRDHAPQALPARASGPAPQLVPYGSQALLAHPAPPRFEAVAEEVEALPRFPTVTHLGLVGVQGKTVSFHPGVHFFQCGLRFFRRPAQYDEVVGIPNHPVPLALHQAVQRVQVEVRQ